MADIQRLIKMLKSNNADERYDACEELRVLPSLPPEALEALRPLIDDTNSDVADAAWRAVELHSPGSYPKKILQPTETRPIDTRKDVNTCKKCGTPLHLSLNHCTNCKEPFRTSRLANNQTYPKVDMPIVKCFAAKQDETLEHISKIVSDKNNDASQMNESEVILQKTVIANQNTAIVLKPCKQAFHFPAPAITA